MRKYSSIVQVNLYEINTAGTTVTIYPNPVKGKELTLQLNNAAEGEYQISIYNAVGQQVYQQLAHTNEGLLRQTIQLPQLPAGMYYVLVKPADGFVMNTRFAVED